MIEFCTGEQIRMWGSIYFSHLYGPYGQLAVIAILREENKANKDPEWSLFLENSANNAISNHLNYNHE